MSKPAPIDTQDKLFEFAANNHLAGGTLMFTAEIGGLLPGQRAKLMNERQLRRYAAGERPQMKDLQGPIDETKMAKLAKNRPFALVNL